MLCWLYMKNGLKTAFFIVLAAVVLTEAALAQPSKNPGLLPSNPFYFAKESLRQLRRALTFDQTAKADLELKYLEEKAGEIRKLLRLRPNDTASLDVSLNAYRYGLTLLKGYLANSTDGLQTKLVDWALRHSQLFGDLGLDDLQAEIEQFLVFYFDRSDAAQSLIKQIGEFKELRAAEILQVTINKPEAAKFVDDLLITFISRVQGGQVTIEGLLSLPGDLLLRIQVLDQVRERVMDPEVKSKINLWRQRLLERAGEEGLITAGIIKNLIRELNQADLDNQSQYLLEQGEKLFDDGNYLAAFGYLTSASAVVGNEALQANFVKGGWSEELALIKVEYDKLLKEKGGWMNQTFVFIANRIAALSDLARTKPQSEDILPGLREVKLMLNVLRADS